jgi:nitroreductase
MDAIDAIQRRTSVRRFRPDPVPRQIVESLLECAVRAPNHKLTEPWRWVVLTGAARDRYADLRAGHRLARYADPASAEAREAAKKQREEALSTPAFIVALVAVSEDETRREEDYAAVMMAIANLMIASEALGLGTYLRTGGIMRDPGVTSLVGLPDGYRIAGILSLGYPQEVEARRRRRPAAELTRWVEE